MSETLKRLNEAVAVGLAGIGPSVEQAFIDDEIKAGLDKRAKSFANAMGVLRKLKSEVNKMKPDVLATLGNDGKPANEATWTPKAWKAKEEAVARLVSLSKVIDEASAAQRNPEPNGQVIAEAYKKMTETADKVSKQLSSTGKGGGGDSESDAD